MDMRIFTKEDGKDPAPTKKNIAISPKLWPQFRAALDQVEEAMVEAGWLDREDLEVRDLMSVGQGNHNDLRNEE